jgi:predicted N-acyltransferase
MSSIDKFIIKLRYSLSYFICGFCHMELDVQIYHRTDEIGEALWNCLGNGLPFTSYSWYRFAEQVLSNDLPVYVILFRNGEPIARGTFWLCWQEPLPVEHSPLRQTLQQVFQRWPLLICRAPIANTSGLILPDESRLRTSALETIACAALDFARKHRASFTFFDYMDDNSAVPLGFADVIMPNPGTQLRIRWSSFDEYVRQLGKSARKDYSRHMNRARDLGIQVQVATQPSQLEEATTLIRSVESHHHIQPNPCLPHLLKHASLVSSHWLTAEIDKQLVGCGLLLRDGDTCCLAALGLNYDVKYVYFQLFYAAIRTAIETGARVVRGGTNAYEIKERLGFQPETNNHVIFSATNPLLRYATRQLLAS